MFERDDSWSNGDGAVVLSPSHLITATDCSSITTTEIDPLVGATCGAQRFNLGRKMVNLYRYGATSAVALGISEVALLIAAGFGVTATVAAVIGTFAGIIPSFCMSRYWIWADAPRTRVGRQVVQYWLTSLVALAVTSLVT